MTAKLEKATLVRLKKSQGTGKNARPRVEPEDNGTFPVQFNPTTLKISRQNNIDKGGATTRTQRRQSPSSQSATLTFDLEFDTAEGDDNGHQLDVRTKTQIIRQFVEPTKTDPPPTIGFKWGSFAFTGIVTQLTEDLDYFSPEGRPLRAKVSVTITEQNLEWEANLLGPAARDDKAATPPGGGNGSGPGSKPTPDPNAAVLAQAGESVQQLLSRIDADPATWRSAMAGLNSPLNLPPGTQVQLNDKTSAGVGVGSTSGFSAGAEARTVATLASALGMEGPASTSGGLGPPMSGSFASGRQAAAGFALAEGGGVAASVTRVASASAQVARTQIRSAFNVPGITPASSAPGADPRSRTYGKGVPLSARRPVTPP
jgi:Contractile injection system tube protein